MLIPIPLVLAADVTPGASVVAALPLWAQFALSGLGLFALSIGASFWSDYVRRLGKGAKPWMLSLSAALNLAAGNPHKAVRAAKAARPARSKATHRCKVCLSTWVQHPDGSWSLVKGTQPSTFPNGSAGKCCDNAAMGDQIEALP